VKVFEVIDDEGTRLDRWLAQCLDGRARNQIQHDIEAGRVRIEGEVRPSRYRVRGGDRIEYELPSPAPTELKPEPIPLNIIFQDEHLLVIDKPAGMVVHPAPGHSGGTVANALLAHCGPSLEGVGEEGRWGIVHRLDRDTSGLMLAARSPQVHDALVAALAERRVRRNYLGLAVGNFKEGEGLIDRPIGRRPKDRKRMGIIEDGRVACTHWRVLTQVDGLSLLGLTLQTGRTHQVRVHLQSIGRPALADPDYGWTKSRTLQILPQTARPKLAAVWPGRQMLHAVRLALDHPVMPRCRLNFQSHLPEDMLGVLRAFWEVEHLDQVIRLWGQEDATAEP